MAEFSGDPASPAKFGHIGRYGASAARGMFPCRMIPALAACCCIVLCLPIALIIALVIWVESPGSPIFVQDRVGLGQRRFRMFKFRSMRDGCDPYSLKLPCDYRVTRIGRILRRTSLDELPQLFNIVKGDMAFIGPRPELPSAIGLYGPSQGARFGIRPGLTGLWQVSGRSDLSFDRKIELDAAYVEGRSISLDLWILARTPWTLISGRGAY